MSDDSIQDAFALEDSTETASSVSLRAAQQRVQQRKRRFTMVSGVGALAGIAATGMTINHFNSNQTNAQPGNVIPKQRIVTPYPAATPGPSPSPEWRKMATAYDIAKEKGIFLDISYPELGQRRVWRKGKLWRDETRTRAYGFDGTHEWVQLTGKNWVITWKPGRKNMYWAKYPGYNYATPHLLRMLDFSVGDAPSLKPRTDGKEITWEIAGYSGLPSTVFRLDKQTMLPRYEKSWRRSHGGADMAEFTGSFGAQVPHDFQERFRPLPLLNFISFPRIIPTDPKLRARGKRSIMATVTQPLETTFSPSPTPAPLIPIVEQGLTVQATYGALPKQGFAPPQGIKTLELDSPQLQEQWLALLRKNSVARLETTNFSSVIRHASRDLQGNVYLIYTGSPLTPEIFRKRIKVQISFPGYDTITAWDSSLRATLPEKMEGKEIHQLTLMPLPGMKTSDKELTLLLTQTQGTEAPQTIPVKIPLIQEPDGPEALTAVFGPPTTADKQRSMTSVLSTAARKARGWQIDTKNADMFETIAKETWPGNPPVEALVALGSLEISAGRNERALQHANRAMKLYQKELDFYKKDKTISPKQLMSQEFQALMAELKDWASL